MQPELQLAGLKQWNSQTESPGGLLKPQLARPLSYHSQLCRSGVKLRICSSNRFPGDDNTGWPRNHTSRTNDPKALSSNPSSKTKTLIKSCVPGKRHRDAYLQKTKKACPLSCWLTATWKPSLTFQCALFLAYFSFCLLLQNKNDKYSSNYYTSSYYTWSAIILIILWICSLVLMF